MTDNELIAEFMGVQVYQTNEEMRAVPLSDLKLWVLPFQLQYDKKWDEIMPVVEKIESFGYAVDVYKNCCEISTEDMIRWEGEDKHGACYKAVVEFIKWYNENR